MLKPFEKIALDEMDQRTLNQFARAAGFFRRGTVVKPAAGFLGKMLRGTGNFIGRGVERYGDALTNHPTRTLLWSVPLAAGIAGAPAAIDKATNNVQPENPYIY